MMSIKKKRTIKDSLHEQRIIKKRVVLFVGLFFATGVVGVIIVLHWFDQRMQQKGGEIKQQSASAGHSVIQQKKYHTIQSREHITLGQQHDAYTTNPPTSGPHAEAVLGGFYPDGLPDEQAVHNLEHGFVWISYKNISDQDRAHIEKIAQKYKQRIIASRRDANDFDGIALVAWGKSMTLATFDEKVTEKFIAKNYNTSPERLAK